MLSPGQLLEGRYRLDSPIAQGGMSTVWGGVQCDLDRPVAIKVLRGGLHEGAVEGFLREAKLAAAIRHRHVLDVLDVGTTLDGRPFMVMELLDGFSLADWLARDEAVSDWELLEIVAMTLSGLAAVHDRGVVHRDVKPENIFLSNDGDGLYPKLLDFGGSRVGGTLASPQMIGTPHYMSPEQIHNEESLDFRTDLWSVAVILYEGLARVHPYDAADTASVVRAIRTEDPVPLQVHRPDLPGEVVRLVHANLNKAREARHGSARALRDEILTVLDRLEDRSGPHPSRIIRSVYPSAPKAARRVDHSSNFSIIPEARATRDERLVPNTVPPRSARRWRRGVAVVVAMATALLVGGGFYLLGVHNRPRGAQHAEPGEATAPHSPTAEHSQASAPSAIEDSAYRRRRP